MAGELRKKTVRGAGFLGLIQLLRWILSLGVAILLYRLLAVSDFGVLALCELYLSLMLILADFGIESATVQRRTRDLGRLLHAGFTIRLAMTTLSFLLIFAGADWLARVGGNPSIAGPLRVFSVVLWIQLAIFKSDVAIKKGIEFKKYLGPELLGALGSAAIALTLAFSGYGYWSLVAAALSNHAIHALLVIRASPQPLFYAWDRELIKKIIFTGIFSMLTTLAFLVLTRAPHFFIARHLTLAHLGFFYLAFNWSNGFVVRVVQVIARVMFPAVASIESDRDRVRGVYNEFLKKTALWAALFNVLVFLTVPNLIPIVLGSKWAVAVIPCQILCLHGFFRAIASANHTVLHSMGLFRHQTKILSIEVLLFFLLMVPMVRIGGLSGVAYALVVTKGVGFLISCPKLFLSLNIRVRDVIKTLVPIIGAATATLVVILTLGGVFRGVPAIAEMAWKGVLGLVAYLSFYLLMDRGGKRELQSLWSDFLLLLPVKSKQKKV